MIQGILPCAGRGILHTAGPHSFRNIFICIRSVKMMGAKPEGPDLRHARFVHFFFPHYTPQAYLLSSVMHGLHALQKPRYHEDQRMGTQFCQQAEGPDRQAVYR